MISGVSLGKGVSATPGMYLLATDTQALGVVAAAATFTALTYANNAGKVQLSSAGVHGLTASPAVGAYIYVAWAAGTGVSGLYQVASVDSILLVTINLTYAVGLGTPTVTLAGSSITMATINVPGGSLGAYGQLIMEVQWSLTNSANAKTLGISYGGTAFMAAAGANFATVDASKEIVNRSATSQISNPLVQIAHGGSTGAMVTGAVDTTVTQPLLITGLPAVANELIQLEFYDIWVNPVT